MKLMNVDGFEKVVLSEDPASGLRAIIAIHNTTLGPALGGTRMWPYANTDEALADVLRLARGMTYKAAVAGLPLGGGKGVIIGDPKRDKSPALFAAYGRFVETLGGCYITTEDVGTTVADMEIVRTKTRHVVGTDRSHGGSGDPSPYTALGVFLGIKVIAERLFGATSLAGRHIAVQGTGAVGRNLIRHLRSDGARVTVADIDPERIELVRKEGDVTVVSQDAIFGLTCDIFSPCALGGVINDRTIDRFRCQAIAGCANNQLDRSELAAKLKQRGILYAPDFVINAGGLISVYHELVGYHEERCLNKVKEIPRTLSQIIDIADKKEISTSEAADLFAAARLSEVS